MPDEPLPPRNRKPIPKAERRQIDLLTAQRLELLGKKPWLDHVTRFVDVKTGENFDRLPFRENWLFSQTAKKRAAAYVAEWTAFAKGRDVSQLQGYVIRPPFRKPVLGELKQSIQALTSEYDQVVQNAKADGLASPVASFIHVRYDTVLRCWDTHMHCVVEVPKEAEDRFFVRLAKSFSTPTVIKDRSQIGRWINYSSGWVIDHRIIRYWPDEVVQEAFDLKSVHLMRKAGSFARFSRSIRGMRATWQQGGVVLEEKETRRKRSGAFSEPSEGGGAVGYVELNKGAEKRWHAVFRRPRMIADQPTESTPGVGVGSRARAYNKTTLSTGSIPSDLNTATLYHKFAFPLSVATRRKIERWRAIWPYGRWNIDDQGLHGFVPRPIRRRLAQLGLI